MFRNIYYDTYQSKVHLWYTTDQGENEYKIDTWTPYVFVKDDLGTVKTIFNDNVKKLKFNSFRSYSDFQKNNKRGLFENNCKPDIQYLVEKYHKIDDHHILPPALKIYSLDIEVHSKNNPNVFPSQQRAEEPITIITVFDWLNDHYYAFGLHEYTPKKDNVTYVYCDDDEKTLMKRFFSFVYKNPPDVYTGWNISLNKKMVISGFDFPYIINRTKNLFGEDTDLYKMLSPIKKVRCWKTGKDLSVNIAGVSLLDYQALYKWFSFNNLEKYTLDFVSKFEINEQKLEYDGSLQDLYNNDWELYCDYNIRDVELIKLLDDKLGYINLVQSLALLSRAPMEDYMAMTSLLEGKLLTYYRRNNLCAPFFAGGVQETYPAAYVKDPHRGLWDWIVSIDIASSYPTAIITLNMSHETYIGRVQHITEDNMIHYVKNREFPEFTLNKSGKVTNFNGNRLVKFNLMLQRGLISVAPCGTMFKTSNQGVIAFIEEDMFSTRKKIKGEMKSLYGVDGKENEVKRKHAFQWALKILLNSLYGIMAVPYSRYFALDIAEAITSCARHTIKMGERFTNEILNDRGNKDMLEIIEEIRDI